MGLLSLLGLGASAPAQAADPTQGGMLPGHFNLPDPTQGGVLPAQFNLPADPNNTVQNATVTASRPRSVNGYDNNPERQAIQDVTSKYPTSGAGSGLGLSNMIPDAVPGAGTLRNVLGTLGDAFLIQSGHQPIHAQQRYNEQIANAMAGFDTDPAAAAARVAATGAPGSADMADKMYNTLQTQKLREAQQESNNSYRQDRMDVAHQQADSRTASQQDLIDQRNRGLAGGIMAAAAATGDPAKYKAARDRVMGTYGKKISNFDADTEIPADMNDFTAGYGMNANQVARNQTSNASIAERATAADNTHKDRQNANATRPPSATGYLAGLIQRQKQGLPLSDAEQGYITTHTTRGNGRAGAVLPPGLQPNGGGGGQASAPTGQPTAYARGPNGSRLGLINGQWVPVK